MFQKMILHYREEVWGDQGYSKCVIGPFENGSLFDIYIYCVMGIFIPVEAIEGSSRVCECGSICAPTQTCSF